MQILFETFFRFFRFCLKRAPCLIFSYVMESIQMVEDDDVEKCVQIHDAGETGFLPLLSTKATGEGRGGHSRSWHTHAGCMQCKRLDAQKGLHLTNISLMRYPQIRFSTRLSTRINKRREWHGHVTSCCMGGLEPLLIWAEKQLNLPFRIPRYRRKKSFWKTFWVSTSLRVFPKWCGGSHDVAQCNVDERKDETWGRGKKACKRPFFGRWKWDSSPFGGWHRDLVAAWMKVHGNLLSWLRFLCLRSDVRVCSSFHRFDSSSSLLCSFSFRLRFTLIQLVLLVFISAYPTASHIMSHVMSPSTVNVFHLLLCWLSVFRFFPSFLSSSRNCLSFLSS